jgi:hypothetical protein
LSKASKLNFFETILIHLLSKASKFGCCPDGETDAEGEDFAGCDSPLMPVMATPDVCGEPKERGPSRNFTTRWFFDLEYGGCTK